MKKIVMKGGYEVLVDDEDYEWLSVMNWSLDGYGYAKNGLLLGRRDDGGTIVKTTLMHRLLTGAQKGEVVDHINRNRLDNRKENLRLVDNSINQINSLKKNKHGYRGIGKEKDKYWYAKCSFKGIRRYSYGYKTAEEAARGYDILARDVQGEYAILNFP